MKIELNKSQDMKNLNLPNDQTHPQNAFIGLARTKWAKSQCRTSPIIIWDLSVVL